MTKSENSGGERENNVLSGSERVDEGRLENTGSVFAVSHVFNFSSVCQNVVWQLEVVSRERGHVLSHHSVISFLRECSVLCGKGINLAKNIPFK